MSDNINEFKVHYPSLTKLVSMTYTDPRQTPEGRKIHAEKCGVFTQGKDVYNGHYIVYNDQGMPGKFIGVFVADNLNEDDEDADPFVHVIAVDKDKSKVAERMNYRMRSCKKQTEEG